MTRRPFKGIFFCTGNPARSHHGGIPAEPWGRWKIPRLQRGQPPKGSWFKPMAFERRTAAIGRMPPDSTEEIAS